MKTMVENIREDLDLLKKEAELLFLKHSTINYRPSYDFVFIGSDYEWKSLDFDGKRIQAKLYKDYCYFVELMGIMISELPPEDFKDFKETADFILSSINQDVEVWESSTTEVLNKVNKQLDAQFNLLDSLYNSREERFIFVPDTNALLINPYLDKWEFDGIKNFEILLTPSVLSELDQLKMSGRNESVRANSKSVIQRIKEYRRRGVLTDGVTLRRGISSIRALAVEPDFNDTFSWLIPDNKDDRLLASFVEIIKTYPNSIVQLITADINLQSKVEYARLSFLEPPVMDKQ